MKDNKRQEHSIIHQWATIGIISPLPYAAFVLSAITASPVEAQISGDGSLGTLVNGSLTDSCPTTLCNITGGTITGGTDKNSSGTLLHSFEQFTSPENAPGYSALFIDPGVSDIIVRVTGGDRSFLNGTLSTSTLSSGAPSTANLFFINPSGITFGPNARLDVGGSFLASTANKVLFDRGVSLATGEASPPNPELLTVSAPVGLGFLSGAASSSIQVQGSGNRLTFGSPNAPDSQFVNRIFQQPLPPGAPFPPLPPISELAVRPGQTLSLVSNGINLNGGSLVSNGGQIELGSIASGTVQINGDLSLSYDSIDRSTDIQFADISITDRSAIEVSNSRSGSIRLRGDNISVLNSSALLAETFPSVSPPPISESATGGNIDIAATGNIEVSGFTAAPAIPFNPPFFSTLSVDAAPGASGNGGQLSLQGQTLTVNSGGQLNAVTYGSGNGGQIVINAEKVAIANGSPFGPSGLFAAAAATGSGNGGQIDIETGQLQLSGGAQINASSLNSGTTGRLTISAEGIDLAGTSDPVEILTSEGPLQITSPTAIRLDSGAASTGKGQPIQIETSRLSISEGAELITTTAGAGEGSDLEVVADEVVVLGRAPSDTQGPSRISTLVAPGATGNGGNLTIDTNRLKVLDSAQVGTSTAGSGRAGDLLVNSAQSVLVSGQTPLGRSGLFANAINSTGAGGNLSVESETLSITNGGTLNVSNFPSGTNAQLPPGQGDAGNLQVSARQISLNQRGIISADTAAGDRGNINLQTQALTLRQNSRITANATGTATGGSINISAPNGFIVAVPTENSDITANAVFGDGGRIEITAQSVLGIEPRPNLTPLSDITTSSTFGLSGETRLETLDTELRAENTPLPQSTDIPLVAQGCNAAGSTSSRFVQSGRGGLSSSPYGSLSRRDSLSDTSLPSSLQNPSGATPNANQTDITEAQSWTTNSQGEVVLLTANLPEANRCTSWQ